MTNATDRMMPKDVDAERALLGAILLTQANADVVRSVLRDGEEEFDHEPNAKLYAVLQHLTQNGQPLDSNLIREEMTRRGHDKLANNEFLAGFLGAVPSEKNAIHYAQRIHGLHLRRKTIHAVEQVLAGAFDPQVKLRDVLATCESRLLELMESAVGSGAVHIAVALEEFFAHINTELGRGLSTGIQSLDDILDGGLRRAELFVLGARPGTGKTAFAIGLLEHVCVQLSKPALLFTLEMPGRSIAGRLLTSRSNVPMRALRAKDLTPTQEFNVAQSREQIKKAKLYVDSSESLSIGEIAARSRIAQRRFGIELIVIDHLHHGIRPSYRAETQELRLRDIVENCKSLAKALEVPIMLLAQLNREAAQIRPNPHNFRGSGAVEEIADIAALLWRPQMIDAASGKAAGVRPEIEEAKLLIVKQRDGPVGDLDLTWRAKLMQFTDGRLLPEPEPPAETKTQRKADEELPF